jgi:hypothetical protein
MMTKECVFARLDVAFSVFLLLCVIMTSCRLAESPQSGSLIGFLFLLNQAFHMLYKRVNVERFVACACVKSRSNCTPQWHTRVVNLFWIVLCANGKHKKYVLECSLFFVCEKNGEEDRRCHNTQPTTYLAHVSRSVT